MSLLLAAMAAATTAEARQMDVFEHAAVMESLLSCDTRMNVRTTA